MLEKRVRKVGYGLFLAVFISICNSIPAAAFTGATHALVGAALGSVVLSIPGAFLVGLASHALLDAIPPLRVRSLCTDRGTARCCGDHYPGIQLLWRPASSRRAAGGVLPDLEHILRELGWQKKAVFPSHSGTLPHKSTTKLWQGIWLEAGLVAALLSLI